MALGEALRQTGSAYKPFIYTAAVEDGMTPEMLVSGAPMDPQFRSALIEIDCFLQLFNGGAVESLLVVNPTQRIDEAWNIWVLLHHALGQPHSFV